MNISTTITEESSVSKNEDSLSGNSNTDDSETSQNLVSESNSNNTKDSIFEGYKLMEVDGGDLSGHREANVVVDIGFGDREYWPFTNEYGLISDKLDLYKWIDT